MATGNLTDNGNTPWYRVRRLRDSDGVHVGAHGAFGTGTVTVQQLINGTAYSVLDADDAALTGDDDFDNFLDLRAGDIVRLNLASATEPDIDWVISGDLLPYNDGLAS